MGSLAEGPTNRKNNVKTTTVEENMHEKGREESMYEMVKIDE